MTAKSNERDKVSALKAIADAQPPFADLLGQQVIHVSRDRVAAQMYVRDQLGNRNGVLHGGAIMAFADNPGGTASFLNLPAGARTTTIESKTNFFSAIAVGDTAYAECTPLHRGRTTMVWQTTPAATASWPHWSRRRNWCCQAGDARVSAGGHPGALTKPKGSGG